MANLANTNNSNNNNYNNNLYFKRVNDAKKMKND